MKWNEVWIRNQSIQTTSSIYLTILVFVHGTSLYSFASCSTTSVFPEHGGPETRMRSGVRRRSSLYSETIIGKRWRRSGQCHWMSKERMMLPAMGTSAISSAELGSWRGGWEKEEREKWVSERERERKRREGRGGKRSEERRRKKEGFSEWNEQGEWQALNASSSVTCVISPVPSVLLIAVAICSCVYRPSSTHNSNGSSWGSLITRPTIWHTSRTWMHGRVFVPLPYTTRAGFFPSHAWRNQGWNACSPSP